MKNIPVEISARHIHLSQKDADVLFGKTFRFRRMKKLSQRTQFATDAHVTLKTKKGTLIVRVLGPHRPHTQVELSKTDTVALGLEPALAASGQFDAALDILASGPAGERALKKCVIVQQRHLHCSPKEAQVLGVNDGELVSVDIASRRPVTFHEILVRVHPNFRLALHLDTDEGNAAGAISGKTVATLWKNKNK